MPNDELRQMVSSMMSAGVPKDKIARAIERYNELHPETEQPAPPPTSGVAPGKLQPTTSPTDFWGGVGESLKSGEAAQAGLLGGLGWLKGATLDLPSSVGSGLQAVGNLITDPVGTVKSIPQGLSNIAHGIADTTSRAGSDPEAFGEMMGQMTGQPLVTEGLIKAGPSMIRAAGTPVAGAGRIMKKYQPVSGMIPRIAEMRTMRNIERGVGGGLETLGENMKQAFPPTVQGQVVPPAIQNGQFYQPQPAGLPPATTIFAGPGGPPPGPPVNPFAGKPAPPAGLLPPPSSIQMPGDIAATMGVEPPAQVIGNMNSPAQPHGIPPEAPKPVSKGATPAAKAAGPEPLVGETYLPKKDVSPATLQHMRDKGLEFAGFDSKGNLIFMPRKG